MKSVLARENRLKQCQVLFGKGIQRPHPFFLEPPWLAQIIERLAQLRRRINHGQSFEVTVIGGQGNFPVPEQVGDTLVHGHPTDRTLSVPCAPTAHMEFPGLIDDGLDAEDPTHFVVHFDPVILDPMFDSGSLEAVFAAQGKHFPIETGMKSPAQKGKYVLGRKMQAGMVKEPRVKVGQRFSGRDQDVGAEFGLIDDPVNPTTA